MKKTIKVLGMHCHSCEVLLSEAIEETGVKVLSANYKKGQIEVDLMQESKLSEINKAIEKEGYRIG